MKNPVPPKSERQWQSGRSQWALSALIALVVVVGGGAWWWKSRAPADAAASAGGPTGAASAAGGSASRRFGGASRVQPVSVAAVRQQDMRVLVSAIGNITALNTAVVHSKVDGELKVIRFKEGQMVKAGQVLAELDPSTYQVQLAQAQGALVRDQAQLASARVDLKRYKDLLAQDSIASQQVDTQVALVAQLEGTVLADQAAVDSAKLQLSYTRVLAPISGRLGLKQVDLGNIVHAADANGIVSITQVQPIAVVFAVPEANLPQINRKLKAGESLPVEAWDREQKNRLAVGRVSTTDNAIDPTTGTIKLKAEFANADSLLFPNQFVNIRLQVDTLVGTLAVPTPAIQRGAQGTFVYAVTADGSVTVRRVRTGATENDWVSVQGELAAGEKVVTDGADRLREGARVEVIAPAATRPGADGQAPRRRGGASAPAGTASSAAAQPAPGGGRPAGGAPGEPAAAGSAPSSPASSSSAAAAASAAEGSERPRWMDRLPPELVEKVKAMSPEDRRAFLQKLRERRQQQDGGSN
jgi:multidrug efflux system membrane fusion protein